MKPTVSVITICYNAEQFIRETICSVLAQTYTDYEYVFIDGNSKDETVSIIESYRAEFEAKGVSYRITSEPDKGIYDAMNKGVRAAQGQWVLMLNAGDCFVDGHVLRDMFEGRSYDEDIVYGDAVMKDIYKGRSYYKYTRPQPVETIQKGMFFCHQCAFVRGELLKKYEFDTAYKIVADYNFFVQAYLNGAKFQYIPRAVAIYDCTGVSTSNLKVAVAESTKIRQKAGFLTDRISWKSLYQKTRDTIRKLMQILCPSVLYSEKRGWYKTFPKNLSEE